MAIIYTYPTKTTPVDADLILISDSADSNKTKQVTVASIKSQTAGVTKIVAGTNVTISPTNGLGDVTINSSGGSGGVTAVTATSPLVSSGGNTPAVSLSGITGFGAAYQVLKVNGTADGLYWDTAGVTSSIYTANGTVGGSGNERSLNFSNTKSLFLNNPTSFIIDASNTAPDYNTAMVHVMKQGTSKFAVMQDGRVIINNDGIVTIPSQETSAILHAKSTDKGFLMPTMTGAQVEAISSPATGLKAYATSAGSGDVTSAGTWTYNGSNWVTPSSNTYSAGDGLDLTGTTFSTDLKANGGLVIESTELAVDLAASSITGTLAVGDGGTGATTIGQYSVFVGTSNTAVERSSSATGAIQLPSGTTAQRPSSPVNGMIRHSTTSGTIEAYIEGSWVNLYTP